MSLEAFISGSFSVKEDILQLEKIPGSFFVKVPSLAGDSIHGCLMCPP